MGFMTGGTEPVPNWAVLELGTVYLFGFLFMTTEAKADLLRPLSEKPFEVRRMGCMTAGTLTFGYRLVGKLGSFYLGHLIMISFLAPVAVDTDGDLGGGQKELTVLGTMRVMAVGALLLDRFMNKPGLVIKSLLLLMATQAEICTGPGETIGRIGNYLAVADHTDACGYRGVNIFDLFHVRMAFF
jgi:hypothetical protein